MPPKGKDDLKKIPDSPLDTPALDDEELRYSYEIARGEMGVLSFEPYKSLILPFWAFRTVPIAQSSAEALWAIFESYVKRGDFVGSDMTRKYIQMGFTRARRYANHKGGRKYDANGKIKKQWSDKDIDGKRKEKEDAAEVFKGYYQRAMHDQKYAELREKWKEEKKQFRSDE